MKNPCFPLGFKRSQVSVEFFLVLSVVIAFTVILYTNASAQVVRARALNDAVLAKSAIDTLTDQIDFVYLSGSGSVVEKTIFVSANSNCFYKNADIRNNIYCTISSEYLKEFSLRVGDPPPFNQFRERVYGRDLVIAKANVVLDVSCAPLTSGWVKTTVTNAATYVNVVCQAVP